MTVTVSAAVRWPAVAARHGRRSAPPSRGLIFERAVRRGPRTRDATPTGAARRRPGTTSPGFELRSSRARFFARLGRDTKIGFGEAYMAGDWRAGRGTDLADLLTPFAARLTSLVPARCRGCAASSTGASPAATRTPSRGARQHQRPLRPEQRPVRGLPRPHDELLLGVVRRRAEPVADRDRGWRRPSSARSTGSWTRRRAGRAPGCWRSAPAGAHSPSGPRSAAPR